MQGDKMFPQRCEGVGKVSSAGGSTYVKELEAGRVIAKDVVDGDEAALRVLGSRNVGPDLLARDLLGQRGVLALVVPVGILVRGSVAAGSGQRHVERVVGGVECMDSRERERER